MEQVLSISQLSRISGRTRKTLLDWANKGRISFITDGSKKTFSLSEVMRVFPDIPGELIEKELNRRLDTLPEVNAPYPTQAPISTQDSRIMELENQVKMLQLQVELLTRQIEIMDRERNTLERQLNIQTEQTTQLLTRMIPAESSARRRTEQPRLKNGQFAPKGEGVAALIPDK